MKKYLMLFLVFAIIGCSSIHVMDILHDDPCPILIAEINYLSDQKIVMEYEFIFDRPWYFGRHFVLERWEEEHWIDVTGNNSLVYFEAGPVNDRKQTIEVNFYDLFRYRIEKNTLYRLTNTLSADLTEEEITILKDLNCNYSEFNQNEEGHYRLLSIVQFTLHE